MKKILPVLLVSALALSMAACTGPTTDPTTAPPTTTTKAPVTCSPADGAWDVCETAYEDVQQGGTFTGSYDFELETFNINHVNGNEMSETLALSPVNADFWQFDGSGAAFANKNYVESVKEDVVDGKLVIDLKMNPKAAWNDGTPMSVDDWKAFVYAMSGENEEFEVAATDGFDQIDSVEQGVDSFNVIIKFKATYPDWTGILSGGPMRAESCKDADTFNTGWDDDFPLGWQSGPFMMESYDKVTGTIVQVPNPNWWGQAPKLDKIIWKMIPDPTASVQAFANQEIDYIDIGPNADGYMQAKNTPNSVVREANGPNFRHFTFNSKAGFLKELAVRQAIVLGLNRTQIAESDLAGLPLEFQPLNNNIFMPAQAGFEDLGAKTGLDYNPEKAKSTLEGAGWVMNAGTGFYEKGGKQLDVKFAELVGVAAAANEYQQAQAMLKEIGINLINQPVDIATQWPKVLYNNDFEIIAFSWMGTPYPLMNVSQIYGTGSESNFAQLTIPVVDQTADDLAAEMDVAKRLGIGQQNAQAIWEAVHTLPLYQRPMLIGVREKLANFGAFGMARQPYDWTAVGYLA